MSKSDLKQEPIYINQPRAFFRRKELIATSEIQVYNVAPYLLRSMMRIKRHSCNTRMKKLINRSLPKKVNSLSGFVLLKSHNELDIYFETKNKNLSFRDYARLAYIKVVKEREYLERFLNKIEIKSYGKKNF
ncbi:hypothetical protein [Elizabethkingia occulta]|uniref:hypothetical protein n=1 Tax=Elizabethkingia occulta TaxID=1867263 RepID=UPI000999B16A|nr:hypothetical protein [Elizabethkingia occulta]OPB92561.1 hypothetical protein BB020_08130 [Elizabethkingia occulta]